MKEELITRAALMGVSLSENQADQLIRYSELLREWNEKINLTAITEPGEILSKHFLDCLSLIPYLRANFPQNCTIIDVGTGAGFPGLVLKIAMPELKMVLLDSLQKRVRFLETVCEELSLEDVVCIHARAEELAHDENYREHFDIATARAVSSLPALAEYCSGYVKSGGEFIAYKGPGWQEEMAENEAVFEKLRLFFEKSLPIELPGTDLRHELVFFRKKGKLSLQYPRSQSKIKKVTKK